MYKDLRLPPRKPNLAGPEISAAHRCLAPPASQVYRSPPLPFECRRSNAVSRTATFLYAFLATLIATIIMTYFLITISSRAMMLHAIPAILAMIPTAKKLRGRSAMVSNLARFNIMMVLAQFNITMSLLVRFNTMSLAHFNMVLLARYILIRLLVRFNMSLAGYRIVEVRLRRLQHHNPLRRMGRWLSRRFMLIIRLVGMGKVTRGFRMLSILFS